MGVSMCVCDGRRVRVWVMGEGRVCGGWGWRRCVCMWCVRRKDMRAKKGERPKDLKA